MSAQVLRPAACACIEGLAAVISLLCASTACIFSSQWLYVKKPWAQPGCENDCRPISRLRREKGCDYLRLAAVPPPCARTAIVARSVISQIRTLLPERGLSFSKCRPGTVSRTLSRDDIAIKSPQVIERWAYLPEPGSVHIRCLPRLGPAVWVRFTAHGICVWAATSR
jgi:hypothetical protein